MGQYQQWLYAQEMDRRLKAEVESLETELLYLKDRVSVLEQSLPETENVILHALQAHQRTHINQESQVWAASGQKISGPLAHRSLAPDEETPRPSALGNAPYYFGQRSEQGLQPAEMLAFFERREQEQSGSWQHQRTTGAQHAFDAETRVQNENIRRWFERWHREVARPTQLEGRRDEQ